MKQLLVILGVIMMLSACQRDNVISEYSENNGPIEVKVFGSVVGTITDDNGQVVEGASIYFGNYETTSNSLGAFTFEDILIPEDAAYIQVEKQGYFKGSRVFSTKLDETPHVKIELLTKDLVDFVNTSTGANVHFENSTINLPAGEYQLSDGTKYTGEILVFAKYLDPTKAETYQQMPGDLLGENSSGEIKALASYGMMGVELTNSFGEYLELPEGSEAEIKMKVPNSILSDAPQTIPLWHFNETDGIWIEEGMAILNGDTYVGKVKHFSFWNCDEPFDFVEIKGYVNLNGDELVGGTLKITDLDSGICRFGFTGERGFFVGKVPKGRNLSFTVIDLCGAEIHTETLGALESDSDLGIINAEGEIETIIIDGVLEPCFGGSIEEGYVVVSGNNVNLIIPLEEDGTFYSEIPGCISTEWVEVYGVDEGNHLISLPEFAPIEALTGLNLMACDNFFQSGYEIFYEGQNWNPISYSDSTATITTNVEIGSGDNITLVQTIIDEVVYDPMEGVQCIARFEFSLSSDEVNYELFFESQGFKITGVCEVETFDIGPIDISVFQDVTDNIIVIDASKYPGEVPEVNFLIMI